MAKSTWIATIFMDPVRREQPREVTVLASSLLDAKLEIRGHYGTDRGGKAHPIEYQHGPVEKP
jgi:hypothetical protein